MQFVREADPLALGPHAELFRKHVSLPCPFRVSNRLCPFLKSQSVKLATLKATHIFNVFFITMELLICVKNHNFARSMQTALVPSRFQNVFRRYAT